MDRLNYATYETLGLDKQEKRNSQYPVKVLQFGEGNFLRAFIDYFIDELNDKGLFDGSICMVQGLSSGRADTMQEQDNLYTVIARGMENGQESEITKIITSVRECINPYEDTTAYFAQVANPDLRFVFSNTTEAGIVYKQGEKLAHTLHESFPAKIAYFLWKRYEAFNGAKDKGLVFFPCELIDNNGHKLKQVVLQYAAEWQLPIEFVQWVEECNVFNNTLVDRIVTGFPKEEFASLCNKLGYVDNMLDTSEIFHFFVIEGPDEIHKEIPFAKAGLQVIWTKDATPYKNRKVRILNGGHTCMVLAAFLAGYNYVGDVVANKTWHQYLHIAMFEEIIPALKVRFAFAEGELESFANAVFDRFANPYIHHELLAIAYNSTSKVRERVLPSIIDSVALKQSLPPILTFSFAAFIAFYKAVDKDEDGYYAYRNGEKYYIKDEPQNVEYFYSLWQSGQALKGIVYDICANTRLWKTDLSEINGFVDMVTQHLLQIDTNGMTKTVEMLVV